MRPTCRHLAVLMLVMAAAVLYAPLAAAQNAEIPSEPQQRLYWNKFLALYDINGHLTAVTSDGLLWLRYDPSFAAFAPERHEPIDMRPLESKLLGDVVVVRTEGDFLYVFDATAIPDFHLLFRIDPPVPYDDFEMHGGALYLSRWFDGVWRYNIGSGGEVAFVDSTMRPVQSTQLLIENDTLYVLDGYNGLERFDLTNGQFDPAGHLLSQRQVLHFDKIGDQFALGLVDPLLYIGEFGHVGSGIVDSVVDTDYIDRVYATDQYYLLQTDRDLQVVRRDNLSIEHTFTADWYEPKGVIREMEEGAALLLPSTGFGATMFFLSPPWVTRDLLFRPGPINHLLFAGDLLLTAGRGNPIDVLTLPAGQPALRQYSIASQFSNVMGMATNGDTLYALLGDARRLAIIPGFTNPDSLEIEASIPVDTTNLLGVKFSDKAFDGWHPIMMPRIGRIDVYATKDSVLAEYKTSWRLIGEPLDFALADSLLVISYTKKEVLLYRVYDDLSVQFRSAFALTDAARQITPIGNQRMLVWARDRVFVLNHSSLVEPSMDTVIYLPFDVRDVAIQGNRVYTIGPQGIGMFELIDNRPVLRVQGGLPGSGIAVSGNQLVTTDQTYLAIYELPMMDEHTDRPHVDRNKPLAKNYPNPFNLSTTIQYSVPVAGQVEVAVYNGLGQRVQTLVDEWKSAGLHAVTWDGRSISGNTVASGVYFLHITTADASDSHKMMLLK